MPNNHVVPCVARPDRVSDVVAGMIAVKAGVAVKIAAAVSP